mgnify:FL=1
MDPLDLFYDAQAELKTTFRELPHWKQQGKVHFLTWRQADSLPRARLEELQSERDAWLMRNGTADVWDLGYWERDAYYKLFHQRVERWLDAGSGSCLLKRPEVREIVSGALSHFNGTRYTLGSFAIASNHVHVLVVPMNGVDLSSTTHSWKSFTAKKINAALGRSGTFWQDESFDHLVRNETSLQRIEAYIVGHAERGALVETKEL